MHALIALLLTIYMIAGALPLASTPVVSVVNGVVVYDLASNEGVVVLNFTLTAPVVNATLALPLIANNIADIINVTDEHGNILAFKYDSENRVLEVMVFDNPVRQVSVVYNLTNLFSEIGVGAYSALLDLAQYSGSSVTVSITLLGVYSVQVVPSAKVSVENGTTLIVLDKPDLYIITAYEEIELGTPTTTQPATPATSTPTTSVATPVIKSSTPQTSATLPQPQTQTPPEAAGSAAQIWTIILIIIIIVIVAAITMFLRKR